MAVELRGVTTVILPGTGSDDDYVYRAFSGPLRAVGAVVVTPPPPTTMLGGLYQHVTAPRAPGYKYGPTNVNYGLLPPLPDLRKDNKKPRMAERARADLARWLAGAGADHLLARRAR